MNGLKATLAPAGISWEQFCTEGYYYRPSLYQKHEQIDPASGEKAGFATPSGKVELVSELLADIKADALPHPVSVGSNSKDYPLTLITGARRQPFYASAYRQIASLRSTHPKPWAEMNAATALKLGQEEGRLAIVETERGRGLFQIKLAEMQTGVISIEYGWWYPETKASEPDLGGMWISNANAMTQADIETSDSCIGTSIYNGIPCRVSRASEEDLRFETELVNER